MGDFSLVNEWPKIEKKLKVGPKPTDEQYYLDADMNKFFVLLETLPTHRTKFETAVASLIKFSKVGF